MSDPINVARRLLPPMAALHSFAAAARHGHFSRAGAEVGLTQSAVSRQIAVLENWLGVQLFERKGRRVELTADGSAYMEAITPALQRIRGATAQMIDRTERGAITIATLPSFGMRWLAPRLPGLTSDRPELVVNFAARSDRFDFATETFDAAIHFGLPDWPGVCHDKLFSESAFPVSSPGLQDMFGSDAAALLRAPLLHLTTRPLAWHRWFATAGVDTPPLAPEPSFEHFLMLAQAAAAGVGIALVPTFLIEPELKSGALVRVSDLALTGQEAYYLVYPPEKAANRRFRDFRDWLLDEAAGQQS
ncbi:LysR substrate-binding domain-containing protein [Blastomonas fulva]|uniref:LysR substrate-binding domain-containing protein n=1 Tax=Blastomonas fulva TaxID=1550728 RepID=UPI003F709A7D